MYAPGVRTVIETVSVRLSVPATSGPPAAARDAPPAFARVRVQVASYKQTPDGHFTRSSAPVETPTRLVAAPPVLNPVPVQLSALDSHVSCADCPLITESGLPLKSAVRVGEYGPSVVSPVPVQLLSAKSVRPSASSSVPLAHCTAGFTVTVAADGALVPPAPVQVTE